MSRLAVLGAGGHGKVVAEIAELVGWDKIALFDDSQSRAFEECPWPICGTISDFIDIHRNFDGVIVAIGNNKVRFSLLYKLATLDVEIISVVHPRAILSQYCTIGKGSVIMANAVVNFGARIELGAILNTACIIEHDCVLGPCVHVSPNASLAGGVHIGKCTWIGMGASVKQLVTVEENVIVGAGAVVLSNVDRNLTIAGVPAVPLNSIL